MLFSKTIKHYSLCVKTFLPLALCVYLCAVSPPNKQKKKNISEQRHFSSNGPEKWIHTSFFFLLSDGINRQYVTTQPPSCKHQYVIGRRLAPCSAAPSCTDAQSDGGARQVCLTQFLYVTRLPLFRESGDVSRCFTQWCRNSWMQTFPLRRSSKWCVSSSALSLSH